MTVVEHAPVVDFYRPCVQHFLTATPKPEHLRWWTDPAYHARVVAAASVVAGLFAAAGVVPVTEFLGTGR